MKIKNLISLLSLIILLFSFVSCSNFDSGPDTETSKTFDISDFTSLNLEIVGEVIYEQSDSVYLTASGSSSLIDDLEVKNDKGELSIDMKNKRKFSKSSKKLIIHVGSPHLQSINSKSIGSLTIKNRFEGDKLSIINTGVGEIIIEDCNVGTFNLDSKSVGSIKVKGKATNTFINSDGVGNIDCSEFKSENAKLICRGTGNLSVYAQKSLDISLTGIGNVDYYGNPADVKTNINGMGKARNMNP